MYWLPSTSRREQPWPESNATGNSFTCPDSPLKYLVQRSCQCFDSGPGTVLVTIFGYWAKSKAYGAGLKCDFFISIILYGFRCKNGGRNESCPNIISLPDI